MSDIVELRGILAGKVFRLLVVLFREVTRRQRRPVDVALASRLGSVIATPRDGTLPSGCQGKSAAFASISASSLSSSLVYFVVVCFCYGL